MNASYNDPQTLGTRVCFPLAEAGWGGVWKLEDPHSLVKKPQTLREAAVSFEP